MRVGLAVVAVVVGIAGCSSPGDPVAEEPPPTTEAGLPEGLPGLIVVAHDADELAVASPDGSGEVVLDATADGVLVQQPTWSPDGTEVAWSAVARDGSTTVRIAAPGDDVTVLDLPVAAFFLQWSTDGSSLAWLGGGDQGTRGGIVDRDGALGELAAGASVFLDGAPGSDGWVVHVDGSDLRRIAPGRPPGVELRSPSGPFAAPEVTADGDIVILVVTREVDGSAEVVPAVARWRDDTGARRAAAEPTTAANVADAGLVGDRPRHVPVQLFVPQEQLGVAVLDAEGTVVDEIATGLSGRRGAFVVDPSAHHVAVWAATTTGRVPLVVVDLLTGRRAPVVADGVRGAWWSPDGSALAVLTDAEAGQMRWVIVDAGGTRGLAPFSPTPEVRSAYVPFADQYARTVTPWSPDGRAIVHTLVEPGEGAWAVVQPVDGTDRARLRPGDVAWWSPGVAVTEADLARVALARSETARAGR